MTYSITMVDWEYQYNKVVAFLRANDGTFPTKKTNKKLHSWLGNQRYLLVKGGNVNNLEERIQKVRKLKALGYNIGAGCASLLMTHDEDYANCTDGRAERNAYEMKDNTIPNITDDLGEEQSDGCEPSTEILRSGDAAPSTRWDSQFEALVAYKKDNGHLNVPYSTLNDSLEAWVRYQRQNSSTLHSKRRALLEKLGFDFSPQREAYESRWNRMLHCLMSYKEQHGGCSPPLRTLYENENLGSWVNNQRANKKKGKMPMDRIQRLVEIGFNFKENCTRPEEGIKPKLHKRWMEQYQKLKQRASLTGDCNIASATLEDRPLANWMVSQRMLNRKNELKDDRKEMLEKLGFDWNPSGCSLISPPVDPINEVAPKGIWEIKFECYSKFRNEYGQVNISQEYKKDGLALGAWLSNQRTYFRKGEMDADRARRMLAVGLPPTEEAIDAWNMWFKKVKYCTSLEGMREHPNWRLRNWICLQDVLFKAGRLSLLRQSRLNTLSFEWKTKESEQELTANEKDTLEQDYLLNNSLMSAGTTKSLLDTPQDENRVQSVHLKRKGEPKGIWEIKFECYRNFRNEHGQVNLPTSYKKDGLGVWLGNQRTYFRKGEMDADRARRMLAVGLPLMEERVDVWNTWFEMAACCATAQDVKEHPNWRLGNWMRLQNVLLKAGRLPRLFQTKLNTLSFEWRTEESDREFSVDEHDNLEKVDPLLNNTQVCEGTTKSLLDSASVGNQEQSATRGISRKRNARESPPVRDHCCKAQRITLLDYDSYCEQPPPQSTNVDEEAPLFDESHSCSLPMADWSSMPSPGQPRHSIEEPFMI